MLKTRRPRFYANVFKRKFEGRDILHVDIYGREPATMTGYAPYIKIGDIHASIKLKTEKGELKMFDTSAELGSSKWHAEFKEMFKRSVEQELVIRAMRWAKKKGATHADLKSIFLGLPPEKETFQRAIQVGLLSKEGKILKIPRQINLKENRWLEKPIIPRRPIIRKHKRKSVFTRRR